LTKISHNRVLITDSDRLAIDNVLTSGWIAEGKVVKDLEGDFVNCLGGGKACAVSSGTAALFLALRGLGIGRGDHVAVPSYSCAALLNAIYMLDAEPLVVDVRLDDFTINVENLLTDYGHIRACIAVHCFGASADVSALCERGILTVEDCCQSLGGPQGLIGDVAVFSFYATKIITGGQGGLLWDETGGVAESARDFREYDGRKSYFPRFNFQMTDISAALIRSQLRRIDQILKRRREIRHAYIDVLPNGLTVQSGLDDPNILPYRFVIRTASETQRNSLLHHLKARGVSTIIPIEGFELLHRYLKLDPKQFPNSESLAKTALSLPLYPDLLDTEINRVVESLKSFT